VPHYKAPPATVIPLPSVTLQADGASGYACAAQGLHVKSMAGRHTG
jgi:hypothetical protein